SLFRSPLKGKINRSKHERSEQVRVPVETRQPNLGCPTALAKETGPKHKRSCRAALEIPWQRGLKTCVNARACFGSLPIQVNGQCQPPLLFRIAVRDKNTRKFAKHLNSYPRMNNSAISASVATSLSELAGASAGAGAGTGVDAASSSFL